MFTLLIAGSVVLLIGVLIGWLIRSHLAAIEKVESTTLNAVDGLFHSLELKLGLIHAAVSAPPPTAAPTATAASNPPTPTA